MRRNFHALIFIVVVCAAACSTPSEEGDSGNRDVRDSSEVGDTDTDDVAPDSRTDTEDVAADTETTDGADDADAADVYSPGEPLDILFIGNSFTFGGPVPVVVDHLANDAGWPDPNVEWSAFGGETLEGHRSRDETLAKVDEGGWEVVVLQEFSTRPTDNRGDPAQFKADATWFHDRIKASSPDARVILYETWARHPDHGIYPGGFDDPAQMQAQLREHYYDCAERYIPENAGQPVDPAVEVAPVGDAWESHLDEPDALRLHGSDDYHAGPRGQYLNGLVIYGTIYRRATAGRSAWEIATGEAVRLQEAADRMTEFERTGGPDGASVPDPGLKSGQAVRVDFGADATTADGWNVMDEPVSGSLFDAVDADGEETAVDVTVSDGFSGNNQQGPGQTELSYPGDVTSDMFWTGSFDGHDAALSSLGRLTVRGLDRSQSYTLRIYAGRTGDDGGRGRLTRYSAGGEVADLDAADNTTETVELSGVRPDELGTLDLDVTVSPDGTSRFAYIGALEIVGEP